MREVREDVDPLAVAGRARPRRRPRGGRAAAARRPSRSRSRACPSRSRGPQRVAQVRRPEAGARPRPGEGRDRGAAVGADDRPAPRPGGLRGRRRPATPTRRSAQSRGCRGRAGTPAARGPGQACRRSARRVRLSTGVDRRSTERPIRACASARTASWPASQPGRAQASRRSTSGSGLVRRMTSVRKPEAALGAEDELAQVRAGGGGRERRHVERAGRGLERAAREQLLDPPGAEAAKARPAGRHPAADRRELEGLGLVSDREAARSPGARRGPGP